MAQSQRIILRWESLSYGRKGCCADTPRDLEKPGRWLIDRDKLHRRWQLKFNGEHIAYDSDMEQLKTLAEDTTNWRPS